MTRLSSADRSADHGIALLSEREGLDFSTTLKSDCAPLNHLVCGILEVTPEVHCLRDPTRGGLAGTLNELAQQSNVGVAIEEDKIPICEEVRAACEVMGFDPLHIANEGKLIAVVPAQKAEETVARMQTTIYGHGASIIGNVVADHPKRVAMQTPFGTNRIIEMPPGELLPRIC